MSQIFTNGKGDSNCYMYPNRSYVGGSLMDFINDIGMVPNHIVTNGSKELTKGLWKETVQKYKIIQTLTVKLHCGLKYPKTLKTSRNYIVQIWLYM